LQTLSSVLKTLLDLRADPNFIAFDGRTALHTAASTGNAIAVKELTLARGIDLERREEVADRKDDDGVGLTAFLLACDIGDRETAVAIASASPLCGHACTDLLESGAHLLASCSTVKGHNVTCRSTGFLSSPS
jgi:ankyrin repeat protein